MATIVEQFGGEGFVDGADFLARTTFEAVGSTGTELAPRSVFGVANEKWLNTRDGGSSTTKAIRRRIDPTDQGGSVREIEVSFAINFATTPSNARTLMYLSIDGSADTYSVGLLTQPSAISGQVNEIYLNFSNTLNQTNGQAPTGILINADAVFYVTMRARSATTSSSSDGALELFINGQLVYSLTGNKWSSSTRNQFTASNGCYFVFEGDADQFIRNVTVADGWTTTDGVAPAFKHVQDLVPSSVSGTDYTNEGGAVDATAAVSDNDDTTYLASSIAGAELTLNYTVDPLLVSYDVADVFTRIRAARGSAALNTIDVDLIENTGSTSVATTSVVLSAVGPGRDQISAPLEPSSIITAGNFSIKITNGS